MEMTFDQFCGCVARKDKLTSAQKAVVLLWWHDREAPGKRLSHTALAKLLHEKGIGNPNPHVLLKNIKATRLTLHTPGEGFLIKISEKEKIASWIPEAKQEVAQMDDFKDSYLSKDIWKDTRGYIEKVCIQLNGCYNYGFYDAASVMLRRLVETLIIEAYEKLGKAEDIKNTDEHFFMLEGLIDATLGKGGLSIGREAKSVLRDIKQLGDRAAHNRKSNAVKNDLSRVYQGVRVATDELINIAELRRTELKQ